MDHTRLTDTELRAVLRRISEQVSGPIEPRWIESIDSLTFELFISRFGSLAQASLEAGCEYQVDNPDPEVYAAGADDADERTELIENLHHIVDRGLRPSLENYHSYGSFRYSERNSLFGSWHAAVLEAGLDATEIPGYVSPATMVEELRRMADQIGAPPSRDFALKQSIIPSEVYTSRFPSWNVALRSAELHPEQIDRTRESIAELEQLAAELGHRPNTVEIKQYLARETLTDLRRQFGSVDDALVATNVPAERDLTPAGSLTGPIDGNAAIPSHTDLLREIFTIKRRYQSSKKSLEDPTNQRDAYETRGVIAEHHYDAQFGSLENAFTYASQLDPRQYRPRRRELPDEPPEILREHALELAEILERRPLIDEVIELTDHSLAQYLEAFPSWDAVFQAESGASPPGATTVLTPTTTELVDSIERVGVSLGRPPTPEEYRETGRYPVETVVRRYGSWPAALRTVGVEIDTEIPDAYLATDLTGETIRRAAILCEERFDHEAVLLDDLYRIMGELGRAPGLDNIEDFGAWPIDAYITTFDDITDVISEPRSEQRMMNRLDNGQIRSQLATDLSRVAALTETNVWPRDIAFFSHYSIPSYLAVFGSLQNAFTEVGIDGNHLPRGVTKWQAAWDPIFEDARAFLAALRNEYEQTGEAPTMAEMYESGTYAQQCYDYYESWREALLAAGISPARRSPSSSATKEELIEDLQNLSKDLGYPPKTTDVKAHGTYGLTAYYNHYSSWERALEDAGLTTNVSSTSSEHALPPPDSESSSDLVNQLMNDIQTKLDDED